MDTLHLARQLKLALRLAGERRLVGLSRFELLTPRLSSVCSNQLSYRPLQHNATRALRQTLSACRIDLLLKPALRNGNGRSSQHSDPSSMDDVNLSKNQARQGPAEAGLYERPDSFKTR